MVKIYPGVVGLHIQLDTGISLAGATKTNFKVTDPDGDGWTWEATPVAGTQDLEYYTLEDDVTLPGKHIIQTYVERSGFSGHGETYTLTITPFGQ